MRARWTKWVGGGGEANAATPLLYDCIIVFMCVHFCTVCLGSLEYCSAVSDCFVFKFV